MFAAALAVVITLTKTHASALAVALVRAHNHILKGGNTQLDVLAASVVKLCKFNSALFENKDTY